MTVFAPWNGNFGDQWATINLLAHRRDPSGTCRLHSPANLRPMHEEILATLDLDHATSLIELTDEPATQQLEGYDVWATPFLPTRSRWVRDSAHLRVCYQLDGLSSADSKNPPPAEERALLAWLGACGFTATALGKQWTVQQCVDIAAASAFFVGVDSGMAHLCHSVGVPTFMLEYRLPIVTCHRGKAYVHCQGTEDFLRHKLPTWIDYLRFVDHPDGHRSTVPRGRKQREASAQRGVQWWLPAAA